MRKISWILTWVPKLLTRKGQLKMRKYRWIMGVEVCLFRNLITLRIASRVSRVETVCNTLTWKGHNILNSVSFPRNSHLIMMKIPSVPEWWHQLQVALTCKITTQAHQLMENHLKQSSHKLKLLITVLKRDKSPIRLKEIILSRM